MSAKIFNIFISIALLANFVTGLMLARDNVVRASESVTNFEGRYPVIDTGQTRFFDNQSEISRPHKGQVFYGQDAEYIRNPSSYTNNGDGTISDDITGLMWQQGFDVAVYQDGLRLAKSCKLGGYSDWRLPTIKELYSLMLFSGRDISGKDINKVPSGAVPFIDRDNFDFEYGSNGQRKIDTQLLSSTIYRGKTMNGDMTVFGLNVADGRIKGYPLNDPRSGGGKKFTVRLVRGNADYGKNNFVDNNDGTITDLATSLMWSMNDSNKGMNWKEALTWVGRKNAENYLGFNDWRLPDAKELQSIVDYNRSPQETNEAAIDPVFEISKIRDERGEINYPFFWTSTTHDNTMVSTQAVYIAFGEALGFFRGRQMGKHGKMNQREVRPQGRGGEGMMHNRRPPRMLGQQSDGQVGNGEHLDGIHNRSKRSAEAIDVHGAGAQRSDPKSGSASDFPQGRGPQGDVIRINNFVRLVRTVE